jgi:integrase
MRDTGMRNERELYRMRIENLNWETRVIFVPDSKTEEGRRRVPMSNPSLTFLNSGAAKGAKDGFSHRSAPSRLTSPQWRRDFAKPESRLGFPKILSSIVGGMITAPGF